MITRLIHPDASIGVEEMNGRRTISVEPRDGLSILGKRWVTDYPLELIEHVLRVKGPVWLCDEIRRDEDPLYVQRFLHWDILNHVGKEDFAGRRMLDFGSGCGASSMILARMFPEAEIVGIELVSEFVELAQHRGRFYGVENRVSFRSSPGPKSLPPKIGTFDYIILSAVYEHLLPNERQVILPLLWSHLKQYGIIFLGETPYRWFPIETHTTGLPFINYLPDRMALYCARRFADGVSSTASWTDLLKMGIRGGTMRGILAILNREGRKLNLSIPRALR